jgi:hypothetical protein
MKKLESFNSHRWKLLRRKLPWHQRRPSIPVNLNLHLSCPFSSLFYFTDKFHNSTFSFEFNRSTGSLRFSANSSGLNKRSKIKRVHKGLNWSKISSTLDGKTIVIKFISLCNSICHWKYVTNKLKMITTIVCMSCNMLVRPLTDIRGSPDQIEKLKSMVESQNKTFDIQKVNIWTLLGCTKLMSFSAASILLWWLSGWHLRQPWGKWVERLLGHRREWVESRRKVKVWTFMHPSYLSTFSEHSNYRSSCSKSSHRNHQTVETSTEETIRKLRFWIWLQCHRKNYKSNQPKDQEVQTDNRNRKTAFLTFIWIWASR